MLLMSLHVSVNTFVMFLLLSGALLRQSTCLSSSLHFMGMKCDATCSLLVFLPRSGLPFWDKVMNISLPFLVHFAEEYALK